ncbi:MAG TPA: hypothetical protein VG448_14055 [Solirubrobacterales bacterium]|nr:hypothetical protein [Solirubrobacterales bacterium]
MLDRDLLHKQEVQASTALRVAYRFVNFSQPDDPVAIEAFRSDAELGKPPRGRSLRIPELREGLSFFRTKELALERWKGIAEYARKRDPLAVPKIGTYLAAVQLQADSGIFYEDLEQQDGHITVWGQPEVLAAGIIEIFSIEG